jgi:hypothetical protein
MYSKKIQLYSLRPLQQNPYTPRDITAVIIQCSKDKQEEGTGEFPVRFKVLMEESMKMLSFLGCSTM